MPMREHIGYGWGDPLDPTKPDQWLHNGQICDYDPAWSTSSVRLVSPFDGVVRGSAYINADRAKTAEAINKARGTGQWLREWLGCDSIGSRFD